MIYLILIIAVIGFFGALGAKIRHNGYVAGHDACNQEQVVAYNNLVKENKKLRDEADNHIADMEAAYEAGHEKARVKLVEIEAKGAKDVTTYPVFSNPQCVLPDDVLHNLNDARATVRSAADPGTADGKVPSASGPE